MAPTSPFGWALADWRISVHCQMYSHFIQISEINLIDYFQKTIKSDWRNIYIFFLHQVNVAFFTKQMILFLVLMMQLIFKMKIQLNFTTIQINKYTYLQVDEIHEIKH